MFPGSPWEISPLIPVSVVDRDPTAMRCVPLDVSRIPVDVEAKLSLAYLEALSGPSDGGKKGRLFISLLK